MNKEEQAYIERLERLTDRLEKLVSDAENPYSPQGRAIVRLTQDAKRDFLRQMAARARAAKQVGKGRGSVKSQSIRRKMIEQAKKEGGI